MARGPERRSLADGLRVARSGSGLVLGQGSRACSCKTGRGEEVEGGGWLIIAAGEMAVRDRKPHQKIHKPQMEEWNSGF